MQQDIELIEKVILKFAYTEDKDLSSTTNLYLVPVIDKLSTQSTAVKDKIFELLAHINKRVKPQKHITLPILDIAIKFATPINPVQENILMLYYNMGWERDTIEHKKQSLLILLPKVSQSAFMMGVEQNIQKMHLEIRTQILAFFLSIIESFNNDYEFLKDYSVREFLVKYLLQFLLLTPAINGTINPNNQNQPGPPAVPPGLSQEIIDTVFKPIKEKITESYLISTKLKILEFIRPLLKQPEIISHNELLTPILTGASDQDLNEEVKRVSEKMLKSLKDVNLEEEKLIKGLFELFLGNKSIGLKCVNTDMRLKIIIYFQSSKLALNYFPKTLEVILDCLFGAKTRPKLKLSGLNFLHKVITDTQEDNLRKISPILLNNAIIPFLQTQKDPSANQEYVGPLKIACYDAIRLIAKRLPIVFSENIKLFKYLFSEVDSEILLTVQDTLKAALEELSICYTNDKQKEFYQIEKILLYHAREGHKYSLYLSSYYANRIYPFSHVPARWINLLGSVSQDKIVQKESQLGLVPNSNNNTKSSPNWPNFKELMEFIAKEVRDKQESEYTTLPPPLFEQVIKFSHKTLKNQIKENKTLSNIIKDWENPAIIDNPIQYYLKLIDEAISPSKALPDSLRSICLRKLKYLLMVYPPFIYSHSKRLHSLVNLVVDLQTNQTRELAANIIGILATVLDQKDRLILVQNFMDQLNTGSYKVKIGALYSIGYIISHLLSRSIEIDNSIIISTIKNHIIPYSKDTQNWELCIAACSSIGLIGRYNVLPITKEELKSVISHLSSLSHRTDRNEFIISAIKALENISLGADSMEIKTQILDIFFQLPIHRISLNHYFSIGISLSTVLFGHHSPSYHDPFLDLEFISQNPQTRPHLDIPEDLTLGYIHRLISELISSRSIDKINDSQILALWLLILTKVGAKMDLMARNIISIQSLFIYVLLLPWPSNSIVPVIASKALVVIHLTYPHMAEALLNNLMLKISPNTYKLQEPNILPQNQHHNLLEVSTTSPLKNYLKIATELNDPTLVYSYLNSPHELFSTPYSRSIVDTSPIKPLTSEDFPKTNPPTNPIL